MGSGGLVHEERTTQHLWRPEASRRGWSLESRGPEEVRVVIYLGASLCLRVTLRILLFIPRAMGATGRVLSKGVLYKISALKILPGCRGGNELRGGQSGYRETVRR